MSTHQPPLIRFTQSELLEIDREMKDRIYDDAWRTECPTTTALVIRIRAKIRAALKASLSSSRNDRV